MTITLYANRSDERKVNKNLTELGTVNCLWKNEGDLINPLLVLDTSTIENLSPLWTCNYCYISTFDRFYFTKIEPNRGHTVNIKCSIDVLYTWSDKILNSTQFVERTTRVNGINNLNVNNPHAYLNDTLYPIRQDKIIQTLKFNRGENPFFNEDNPQTKDSNCYVLSVLGPMGGGE